MNLLLINLIDQFNRLVLAITNVSSYCLQLHYIRGGPHPKAWAMMVLYSGIQMSQDYSIVVHTNASIADKWISERHYLMSYAVNWEGNWAILVWTTADYKDFNNNPYIICRGGWIHQFCNSWFTWIHKMIEMIQFNSIHIFWVLKRDSIPNSKLYYHRGQQFNSWFFQSYGKLEPI